MAPASAPASAHSAATPPRQLATLHFTAELRDWIVQALQRGGVAAE